MPIQKKKIIEKLMDVGFSPVGSAYVYTTLKGCGDQFIHKFTYCPCENTFYINARYSTIPWTLVEEGLLESQNSLNQAAKDKWLEIKEKLKGHDYEVFSRNPTIENKQGNLILDSELDIKVFTYDSEGHRDSHIQTMTSQGYNVKKSGMANIDTSGTINGYSDVKKWVPFAEFFKINKNVETNKHISYHTEQYSFNIYNPDRSSKK